MIQLDNGRTKVVADKVGRAALHCIRCSACLNVCPGPHPHRRARRHRFRPIHLGETAGSLDAVDSLARLWFLPALQEGSGRPPAVRFLTQAADPAS